MLGIGKLVVGLVAAAGTVTTVAVAVAPTAGETDQAVVTKLVDGDTVDVSLDGATQRIRLLNIDAPETKDPNEPVQCLGPEAAAFVATLIPVGSTVTLEYDEVRTDRYDRTLAGVLAADGTLVNAEVARQGLAVPVVFDGNDQFHPAVVDAWAEAEAAGRGLFADDVECTLPARVDALTAAATTAPTVASLGPTATVEELSGAVGEAAVITATALALQRAFDGDRSGPVWAAVPRSERDRLAAAVAAALRTARSAQTDLRAAVQDAREREAARAAADREAEQEARQEAARAAEQERRDREAAARRRAETPPAAAPAPLAAPAPAASGGCASGYSPCVPSYPPDLDCGQLDGPYSVSGSDPHRLDADDDGRGCE